MCPNCEDYSEAIPILQPNKFYRLACKLRELIGERRLEFVKGNSDPDDVRADKCWPADLVEQFFRCPNCHQGFHLEVETYHGPGGAWKMLA